MSGALTGVRILDLSWVLSGPFATMILSDLGAEIIKIERPGSGDLARGNGPFIEGESSYFMSINRGKKSMTINLQNELGKEQFLKLVKKADVVVENFVPGTMKRLGLDYDVLNQHNPSIIYAAISGFGQTGPRSHAPALDIVIQAMGGMMSITGEPGGPPVKPGASLGDITAGLFAVVGIQAALIERGKSGQGQMIDISMMDCQMALLENAFARHFATGIIPQRIGNRHAVFTPFQTFETKDGYIAIAMVGGVRNQWPLFCAAIGHLEMIDDERYQTGELRTQHYTELEPILSQAIKLKTTDNWLKELSELDIPCGPINNIAQVAADPQTQARGMIVEMPHKKLGKVKMINSPIKLSRTPVKLEIPAPELGQDTRELLKDLLNETDIEIDNLRSAGAI